jgi:hypothetical protein
MRKLLYASIGTLIALSAFNAPARATTFTNGEFETYDQTIWGGPLIPGTPPELLTQNYSHLYPGVLELGIPLSSGGHFMDFTDSSTVLAYLPQSAAPGALNANLTDPTFTTAGIFGGQLLALRLNIDFSDAGLLQHPVGIGFGDLILTGFTGTLTGLNGQTVRQLQDIANVMIGGGSEPYPFVDISQLLNDTDESFDGGFASKDVSFNVDDHFLLPDAGGGGNAVPEPNTLALFGTTLASLGFLRHRRKGRVAVRPFRR